MGAWIYLQVVLTMQYKGGSLQYFVRSWGFCPRKCIIYIEIMTILFLVHPQVHMAVIMKQNHFQTYIKFKDINGWSR